MSALEQITWVSDDSLLYLVPDDSRAAMLRSGKICFRTCFRQAYIPLSYLVTLVNTEYNAESEPQGLQEAVDHWLMCECLSAIGGHSVL